MNKCTRFDELEVQRYYDDELDEASRAQFSGHLTDCAPCQNALERLGGLSRQLSSLFHEEVPADLVPGMVRRAREMQLQRSRRIAWGLVAAASFLLVSSLFLVGYSQSDREPASAYVAQWEENVVLPPVVDDEFSDLNTRTLVAIHIQTDRTSENGNE